MKSHLTLASTATDEAAMEAVAAIEAIANRARREIQSLQVQVQRHMAVAQRQARQLGERAA